MTRLPVTCELWVDGVRVADVAGDAPAALDDLSVRWGRSTSIDQPEPATCTVTILDRGRGDVRLDQVAALGSTLVVIAAVGADRRVVFGGRVTDLEISYDDEKAGAALDIVAADLLADLANRYVGTEPWAQETLAARATRIMTAVGGSGAGVVADARPGALPVSRMDVDRQAAANLLRDLATSGSAALWVVVSAAAPTAPTLRIEDTTARVSLWVFAPGSDALWRPMPSPTAGDALTAAAILADPVRWLRSTADLITRTTVRWLDQTTTPGTTERSVGIIDTAAEKVFGARGLSIGTILADAASATKAAQLVMASHGPSEAWRAEGLVWDLDHSAADDATTRTLALNLLDNATRFGRAVRVGPLPWWTPAAGEAGLYVDGGTYRHRNGRWTLSLTTTSGIGAGGSMSYKQTPRTVRYQDVAPDVSYLDLIGVSAPPTVLADPAPADPATADDPAPGTRGHDNTYGFTVPDSTDPYRDTPAALAALRADVAPKLANLAFQFIPVQTISHDANGDAVVNLSTRFASITGAVVACNGPAAYEPVFYQWVQVGGEPAQGRLRLRALKISGADGTPLTNNTTNVSMTVWGVPK